jgi:hypothetical protein
MIADSDTIPAEVAASSRHVRKWNLPVRDRDVKTAPVRRNEED